MKVEQLEMFPVIEHKDGTVSDVNGQMLFPFMGGKNYSKQDHEKGIKNSIGDNPKNAEALMRIKKAMNGNKG